MGDFYKMVIALAMIFMTFVFVTGRGGLDKTKSVKNAERAVKINYPLKVEAELLKPITGHLPSFMILYMQHLGPSSSADIVLGKAIVFVNKDSMGRLTLEKGPKDAFAVNNDKIWWSEQTNLCLCVAHLYLK